ncbi:MAG: isochorismate synthase [Leptolyngbyaceae cyanobacterium SM1_1_3]|nr:isochorismate synthase [Leptolyngbyaceae cyanobacterium SM1_1_3]NJO08822.1 isochorismate synthase [Leptolyngbyaceae cyanobacterium SL_1_1]
MRTISPLSCPSPLIDARQLLEAYDDQTSCFFATPAQTLLAQGIRAVLPSPQGQLSRQDLPQQAMRLLEQQSRLGLPPAPLMGAIPFDDSAAVHLFVPEQIYRAGPIEKHHAAAKPRDLSQNPCLQMIPEPARYMQGVEQALERIQRSDLLKVVLSRALELSFPKALDLGWLLANLAHYNRHGYTYLFNLPPSQSRSKELQTLIGASPELLVRRRGMQVEANPLAGSAPRSGDLATDRQRALDLLSSDKDRREHALVVDAIAETLKPLCRELDIPSSPCILQTDSMMHLSTCLRGTLRDTDTCALSLALALHPTPAVCGYPPQCAYAAIHEIEPFARRYFTGLVGWVDGQGDGEWAVTIRCGEAEGCRLRLYAGAGVVAGSTAEKELAETSAKFRTMLRALGLERLLEVKA